MNPEFIALLKENRRGILFVKYYSASKGYLRASRSRKDRDLRGYTRAMEIHFADYILYYTGYARQV